MLQAENEQLKRQIEELTGRIGELMAEKDTLQNRNSLLEKVVQVRSTSDKHAQAQVFFCGNPCMFCVQIQLTSVRADSSLPAEATIFRL